MKAMVVTNPKTLISSVIVKEGSGEVRNVTQEIESRFRASFEEAAKLLSERVATVSTTVSALVTGVDNHMHALSLECLFPNAKPDEPDLLALCITTQNINTAPEIHVDICWGHPSGYVEADLFETSVKVNKESLDAIALGLPKLYQTLEEVVTRGRPSNQ